jgi:hypothetical protein
MSAFSAKPDELSTPPARDSGETASKLRLWEERIRSVQALNVNPETLSRIKASNERQRSAFMAAKQASRLERTNVMNCAQSALALQTFQAHDMHRSAPPSSSFGFASASASGAAPFGAAPSGAAPAFGMSSFGAPVSAPPAHAYEESASRIKKYSESIKKSCMKRADDRSTMRSAKTKAWTEEDEDEGDLDVLAAGMSEDIATDTARGFGAPPPTSAVMNVFGYRHMDARAREDLTATISSEIMTLLQQLAVEPTNDAEMAAKFLLFENFLENVTMIRNETLAFWATNKEQFVGGTRTNSEREIAGIDSHEAMGIIDDPSKWFVYSMTKKANENSAKIGQVLAKLRSRLEVLSQEIGECPYCLTQMTLGESTVLSCCHRVCTECWDNWVAIKGDAAFCPLCRHEEFIHEVLR